MNREVDQKPTRWIIDFGMMAKEEAEEFAGAIRHVRKHVYPVRKENRRESYAENLVAVREPRARSCGRRSRRIDARLRDPRVSPHLLVTRQTQQICFDSQLMVVAALGLLSLRHPPVGRA